MGLVERRQRQKEEVRNSILTAAWEQVLAEGWASLSIRKIADAIEYSVPVIYSHFASKDAILLEFTRQGFQRLIGQIKESALCEKEPAERLEGIAQTYWQFAFDNREYYQLMFGLGIPTCETANHIVEMRQFSEVITHTINQLIASGPNADADVYLKFKTYWSILHGLVSIQMIDPTAATNKQNTAVLHDAISGFVKSLTH
ncbi:TetR family transcriptional regulator [Spirosoma oryzae]|uniref:TetR family transcriptional regulator n=1 Tax=Spirosoma oryzae TaxID=1469603 RepID=A0A2T0SLB2_9BACT|nr:TetR/AcrR family transcriptional regulator [Spirosoma oryzae]PRY34185.1 TetR family transcriptional regulator [Spirosoma oryzae]